MSDINIGDMVYDVEAPYRMNGGDLFGWVAAGKDDWWIVEWNDGCRLDCYSGKIREMKKEWHKLRKKCLTGKRK